MVPMSTVVSNGFILQTIHLVINSLFTCFNLIDGDMTAATKPLSSSHARPRSDAHTCSMLFTVHGPLTSQVPADIQTIAELLF